MVLMMGVILLGAGCLSLLVVRLTSPGLQGVGRFSAAFAAGTLGAGLQLVHGVPLLSVLLTDLALLSSFMLMHMAVLQIARTRAARVWHGLALLTVQAGVDSLCLAGVLRPRVRLVSLGLLVAVQASATAVALWPLLRGKVKAPAAYCIVLLAGFSAINLLRSGFVVFGRIGAEFQLHLGFLTFALFLVVSLGLAFGFLWMTTATLTAEVEHIASTDPLTRVYTRRVFLKWCEKELLRTQRSGIAFSLLMIDLDHFKMVNDNFGHQRGDEVLCAAVERMQDSVRGIDVLCRWGGEEFAVLLPNAPGAATRIVAERIRENIQKMQVPLEQNTSKNSGERRLTVSVGAATYQDLDDNIGAMLARADQALYRAKAEGRNRVLVGA